jgi:hypothetical protein
VKKQRISCLNPSCEETDVWRSGWPMLWIITTEQSTRGRITEIPVASHCRTKPGRRFIVLKMYMLTGPDLGRECSDWGLLKKTKTISVDFTEAFVSLKSREVSLCF